MMIAFQVIMLIAATISCLGCLAEGRNTNKYLMVLGTSGALFLLSDLIDGILQHL